MQARSAGAQCLVSIFFAIAAAVPFSSSSQGMAIPRAQWVAPRPAFALGLGSGAQLGARASAAILASALIGGLVGALSPPAYHQASLVPYSGLLHQTADPPTVNSKHGAWIADSWQPFGNSQSDSIEKNRAIGSQFVDKWQQFFEPGW